MKCDCTFSDGRTELVDGELYIRSKTDNILQSRYSLIDSFPFLDRNEEDHRGRNILVIFFGGIFLAATLSCLVYCILRFLKNEKDFHLFIFAGLILTVFTWYIFSKIKKSRREYCFYMMDGTIGSLVSFGKQEEQEREFISNLEWELKRCSLIEKKMDKETDVYSPEYLSILELCGNHDEALRRKHLPLTSETGQ